MPVTQLLSVVGRSAGGGGGGGGAGPLTPVDSGTSLGTTWTVEFVGEFYPTTYWAVMWGNENYNASQGHFAYLGSTTYLNVGSPNAMDEYSLAQDVAVKSYWAFVHSDGGGISVYRNGQLLTPNISSYSQPGSLAGNTLIFGARHGNDGTGQTDAISNGTFYWTNISGIALSAGDVLTQYNLLQVTYGL